MENLPVAIEAISADNAPAIYKTDGLKPFIQHIKEQVVGEVPDLSTAKGRERIASLAFKVSKSKTAVEKHGREYLKRLKELPKEVEKELKSFVDECDALRDEVRKPLTDWENVEAARVAAHKSAIESFGIASQSGGSAAEIAGIVEQLKGHPVGDHCEEFLAEYVKARESAFALLEQRYNAALSFEQQQAELERLRQEAAIREQKEREERLMREAAEAARLAAEQQASKERAEAERKANEEKLAAERREMQLKLEAENAERRRLEAEQAAERERQQAELRVKQAAEAERIRIEQQQAAEKAEAERKAANVEHQRNVNREILAALIDNGVAEDVAKNVIRLAASGLIGRMTINY